MSLAQAKLLGIIACITLLSGIADAQGFIHAAKIWQADELAWHELAKSALGFSIGISMYWFSLKYMKALGVVTPEVQTIVWFGVTLIGVALVSGQVFAWPVLEQTVALGVLLGIGWLLLRTGG